MTNVKYKQFAPTAKKQIEGEAFFEALIGACSIPHKVVAPKDLGIDFFCEWAPDNKPTGILFAAQVRTSSEDVAKPIQVDWVKGEDDTDLPRYKIPNELFRMKKNTLEYWKRLGMPVYLFAVIESTRDSEGKKGLTIYYKRYTAFLHGKVKKEKFHTFEAFNKVGEKDEFHTYKYPDRKLKGFARDLFIDYMRCCYIKGSMPYVNPAEIGVGGYEHFKPGGYFEDLLMTDYKEEILTTFSWTKAQLEDAKLISK